MKLYDIKVMDAKLEPISLADYQGKVLLIVNTASYCGFTPQFEGLQHLYEQFKDEGFEVLAFPCNQFNEQDPDRIDQIIEFCQKQFQVTFKIFNKVEVNGDGAHPLFQFLKSQQKGVLNEAIKWNFTKFLVNREGEVVKRFAPTTTPKEIEKDIKNLLGS